MHHDHLILWTYIDNWATCSLSPLGSSMDPRFLRSRRTSSLVVHMTTIISTLIMQPFCLLHPHSFSSVLYNYWLLTATFSTSCSPSWLIGSSGWPIPHGLSSGIPTILGFMPNSIKTIASQCVTYRSNMAKQATCPTPDLCVGSTNISSTISPAIFCSMTIFIAWKEITMKNIIIPGFLNMFGGWSSSGWNIWFALHFFCFYHLISFILLN